MLRTSAISRTFIGSCTEVVFLFTLLIAERNTRDEKDPARTSFVNHPPKDVHKPHRNSKKMRSRRTNKTSSTISSMSATRRSRKRNDTKKVGKRTEARALRGTTPVIHLDDAIIVIVLTSIQSRSNMRKYARISKLIAPEHTVKDPSMGGHA